MPMVAFDDAAAGQLIQHGINGMLAPGDDVEFFLQCAIDLAVSPQWRDSIGADAKARMTSLGWDAIMCKIESLYTRTIHGAGARTV